MDYQPIAVFAPGNYIYDFFPGVKVSLFHGYPINKRGDEKDDHFSVRGWFDVYCTQGETSTLPFKELETPAMSVRPSQVRIISFFLHSPAASTLWDSGAL